MIASDAVQAALQHARPDSDNYFDWFLVVIDAGEGQIRVPIEKVPSTLVPFFTLVDDVWSENFGLHYNSIVESLEEMAMPDPP